MSSSCACAWIKYSYVIDTKLSFVYMCIHIIFCSRIFLWYTDCVHTCKLTVCIHVYWLCIHVHWLYAYIYMILQFESTTTWVPVSRTPSCPATLVHLLPRSPAFSSCKCSSLHIIQTLSYLDLLPPPPAFTFEEVKVKCKLVYLPTESYENFSVFRKKVVCVPDETSMRLMLALWWMYDSAQGTFVCVESTLHIAYSDPEICCFWLLNFAL
jgi:hypothetical protein